MTPLEMIDEWKKGCTCAGPIYDKLNGHPEGTTPPEECLECTAGLIRAIEGNLRNRKMTVQDELRKIADMLDQKECGFLSGGISVSVEEAGSIRIESDLRVQPLGGMAEPTMFVTEFLRVGSDGPEIVRMPLSEWPEWAHALRARFYSHD